jgi:hypothetical protein
LSYKLTSWHFLYWLSLQSSISPGISNPALFTIPHRSEKVEWVSDYCFTPNEQFFSYIMAYDKLLSLKHFYHRYVSLKVHVIMRGGSVGTLVRDPEYQEGACESLYDPIALAIDALFWFFIFSNVPTEPPLIITCTFRLTYRW